MILDYYGRKVPLDQICEENGVTSDGCSAGDIVRAAKRYGLVCHGYKTDAEKLRHVNTPAIIHWCNNHFLILEEIMGDDVYVNDPAIGRIRINFASLCQNYSGVTLVFKEGCSNMKLKELASKETTIAEVEPNLSVLPEYKEQQGFTLSPDEIEEEVLRVWHDLGEQWTPPRDTDVYFASPYAKFLCESACLRGYYFYVPVLKKYYHIEIDGNYYHGYYTDVKPLTKDDLLCKLQQYANREGLKKETYTSLETGKKRKWDNIEINVISWADLIERIKAFPG